MKNCMNVSFVFRNKEYFAIIRHQAAEQKGFYHIRVMNQKLNALLNKGNCSLLREEHGKIILPENANTRKEHEQLRQAIVKEMMKNINPPKHTYKYQWLKSYDMLTPF